MNKKTFIAYSDGGCNNKEHSGGYGSFAVFGLDELVKSDTFLCEARTSNEAEYIALIHLLEYLIDFQGKRTGLTYNIYSDSKLMVNQLISDWNVNAPNLKILNSRAKKLYNKLHGTSTITLEWTPRKNIVSVLGH